MNKHEQPRSLPLAAAMSVGVARCSSFLPITWARGLGSVLGAACARLPVPMRAVTDVNLRLCYPDMSKAERTALLRRSLRETGKSMLELPAILFWSMKRLANLEEEPVGQELLHRAMKRGKGVVLLLPHVGNWEFLNSFLARSYSFTYLYRPPRIEEFERTLRRGRERTGCDDMIRKLEAIS